MSLGVSFTWKIITVMYNAKDIPVPDGMWAKDPEVE